MRLVSFTRDGERRVGGRANGGIVDLNAVADDVPPDMLALLAGGDATLAAARQALADGESRPDAQAPADARLLPAVPHPPKIICIARNYAEHAAEANLELLEYPNIFIRYPRSLLADGDPIQVPTVSHEVDWEAELAVIIGKEGKHIPRERALEHVAGYAIFNDVSVRDWQLRVKQFGAGKNFDASGPLGPDLVTADEVPDPQALGIELRVNDEVMQSSSTAHMVFSVAELIEHISSYSTLEPGDVIATGTPSGVGHFRKPPVYLRAGDTVRIEIERLGVQENPVIDEPPA
jgi:2-keto-4-pentenoate hydratase/2-oxohepta-3-ene-1,7-dioic acid hydratase in catechol pathway